MNRLFAIAVNYDFEITNFAEILINKIHKNKYSR